SVVVQNMPGAGSNKAAGYIVLQAPRDGSVIGAVQAGAILQPLLSSQKLSHDASKLVMLGSSNHEVYLCYVRADTPVKTFQDTFTHEVVLGAAAEGATLRDHPVLLDNVLGTRFRIVPGYGGSELMLAVERGEVQGACGVGWASLTMHHSDWITNCF